MNFIQYLKQGFKQNQLIKTVLRPKHALQPLESEDRELQQSLTFFNRVMQQVSIIEMNHHVTSIESETCLEPPSQLILCPYIPMGTSSILNQIDPVYSIESISPKLLRYQLQLIEGDKQDIQQHLSSLQESLMVVQQQIQNNLQNNHQFLYGSFINIQQTYSQLLALSQSISTCRTGIKSNLFRRLEMYRRLQSKSSRLRQIKGKMEFLIDFRNKVGVVYSNQGVMHQRIRAISNNLNTINTNSQLFKRVTSLQNIKERCIVAISECELELGKRVKQYIFQKHDPEQIQDIILSSYLLHYLFKIQQNKVLLNSVHQHLSVIQEFINNPTKCNNIKDYLQIIYKYLRNVNNFKTCLKSIKPNPNHQQIDTQSYLTYLKQLKDELHITLEQFFKKGYQTLGDICSHIVSAAKEDDRKMIKKFIEMVDGEHLSDGFIGFKNRIKGDLKRV